MKHTEYSSRYEGRAALSCEETYSFAGSRYTDCLRQAELEQRLKGSDVPQPAGSREMGTGLFFKRLAVFGRAVGALFLAW